MPNESNSPSTITTNEAAKLAGVTAKTIRNWRKRDCFSFFSTTTDKGATRIHIDAKSFMSFLEGKKNQKSPPKKSNIPTSPVNFKGKDDVLFQLFLKGQEVNLASKDAIIKEKDKRIEEQLLVIQELRAQIDVLRRFEQEYHAVLNMSAWDRIFARLKPVDTSRILEVK